MIKDYYEDIDKYRKVKIVDILCVKNRGGKACIRCPFHSDKTASFWIYPDNSYFCFGCRVSGQNAIDFMEELGCSFVEAKEELRKYI